MLQNKKTLITWNIAHVSSSDRKVWSHPERKTLLLQIQKIKGFFFRYFILYSLDLFPLLTLRLKLKLYPTKNANLKSLITNLNCKFFKSLSTE